MNEFEQRNQMMAEQMAADPAVQTTTRQWFDRVSRFEYSYHFTWLGRPVIQFPQDLIAMQELIWRVKPDLIIETGIAHGGSLIFYASMLELLGSSGRVVGIDIDIRDHNRVEIGRHPMAKRIHMIQASSIAESTAALVREQAAGTKCRMVVLDSNHTHDHVKQELALYSPLVTRGSYLVVFDTIVEDMPADFFPNRPWGKGNNPRTAVREFLKTNSRFVVDRETENKLLITVAPEGYLKCIAD